MDSIIDQLLQLFQTSRDDAAVTWGVTAVTSSYLVNFIGIPAQIWRTFRLKSCRELSFWLIFISGTCSGSYAIYGVLRPDGFLVYSETPAAIGLAVLCFQYMYYSFVFPRMAHGRRHRQMIEEKKCMLIACAEKEEVQQRKAA